MRSGRLSSMSLPEHCAAPYDQLSDRTKAVMRHDYRDAEGRLLWQIVRYLGDRGGLKERTFVPAARGGWWKCKPRDSLLPAEDQRVDRYPLYRLPELLAVTQAVESRQVWVVDDERCVDAVLSMADPPASGPPPCTCLYGRKYDFRLFDLEPLRGQHVALLAAASKTSRDYVQRLAQELARLGCRVRQALPPGDTGYSVADVLEKGGWYSARAWLAEVGVEDYVPPSLKPAKRPKTEARAETCAADTKPPEVEIGAMPSLADTKHLRVLGYDNDGCIVLCLKGETYRRIKLVRPTSRVRSNTLLCLAPYEWWLKICAPDGSQTRLTPSLCSKIMPALKRAAERIGMFDSAAVRGCGANVEPNGLLVYNLGDRLLLQDGDALNKEVGFDEVSGEHIYISGKRIELEDHPDAERWSREMYECVLNCHWESQVYARAVLGWAVAAVVGGALPFRPMLWLTGSIGTDKMFLQENVLLPLMKPLIRNLVIVPLTPRAEVGVQRYMDRDSLTLMLDEFELETSRSRRERQRAILDLTRPSPRHWAGAQHRGRRTAYPEPFSRFSAVFASTSSPDAFDENLSHFFFVRMAQKPAPDWPVVRQALRRALCPQRAAAIRTWIIRNIPVVVARAAVLEREFAFRYNLSASEARMSAALTAGAELLSGDATPVLREHARSSNFSQYAILTHMLSKPVHGPDGKQISLEDCLQHCVVGAHEGGRGHRYRYRGYAKIAERYGFRLDWRDDSLDAVRLRVAPGSKPMRGLLRGTEWENVNLRGYFKCLPRVQSPKTNSGRPARCRFNGIVASYVVLPPALLKEAGFCPDGVRGSIKAD